MPFTQVEAEKKATVEATPGTRGQLKLWQKGSEVMVEIYGPWGPLLAIITVQGSELEEAIHSLGAWK